MERIFKNLYLLTSIAMLAVGCTTTQYVPVESVRVDSVYIAKVERDSIYERDSVFVTMRLTQCFSRACSISIATGMCATL